VSQLERVTTRDVWCPSEEYPSPGVFVKHIADDKSLGMIVGREGTDLLVLWSKQPFHIKIETRDIKPTSRKLRIKFSVVPDVMSPEFQQLAQHEVHEDFAPGELTPSGINWYQRHGGRVTLHQDGHAEVDRTVSDLGEYDLKRAQVEYETRRR